MVRIIKTYALCNFQYMIVLLTLVSMLHIRFQGFIHHIAQSLDLDYFHILAIMNNAVISMRVHILLIFYFHFLWVMPISGIAASYCNSIFNFLRYLSHNG